MHKGKRTLHKKDGCYYATKIDDFKEFDSIDELENSGMQFLKCKKCFPNKK